MVSLIIMVLLEFFLSVQGQSESTIQLHVSVRCFTHGLQVAVSIYIAHHLVLHGLMQDFY